MSELMHMQVTGKKITDIFVDALDPTQVLSITRALLDLTQSNLPGRHQSRMMILGALAAAGQGGTANIVETSDPLLVVPNLAQFRLEVDE
jgi:hypothetical protein